LTKLESFIIDKERNHIPGDKAVPLLVFYIYHAAYLHKFGYQLFALLFVFGLQMKKRRLFWQLV
jgi:hypothetical protein